MRRLTPEASDLTDTDLADLFAPGAPHWLRAVFVSTLDGAATGADGRSGSINNEVDHRIFDLLRAAGDVVLVGAATAAIEEYAGLDKPLVLISRTGQVPPTLRSAAPGTVRIALPAAAPHRAEAVQILGADNVFALGETEVDLVALRARLHQEYDVINCEGGPRILGALLAAGMLDELDLSVTPLAVGGTHPRIVAGDDLEVDFVLDTVVAEDSTLVCRWIRRGDGPAE